MTITTLNVTIIVISLVGAILQVLGSRLEQKACKHIKLSYALTLLASAAFLIYGEVINETETGYGFALLIVTFNIVVGATYRYIVLRKRRASLCRKCPYA